MGFNKRKMEQRRLRAAEKERMRAARPSGRSTTMASGL